MADKEQDIEEMDDAVASDMENEVRDDADGDPAAQATSSSAKDEDASALSIVQDVVQDKSEQPEDDADSSPEAEAATDASPEAEQADEDYSDVPFHKHPRFQELVKEKNTYRDKLAGIEQQAEAWQRDADNYRNVETFIRNQGLEAQEAADLLHIGGLMKSNPPEAWRLARPIIQKLLVAAGEVVPDDLRGRVESGELSQDMALETARLRAQQQVSTAQQRLNEQQRDAGISEQRQQLIYDTVALWEQERRSRDPRFDDKTEALRREIAFLQRTEGVPSNPQGARDQLDRAYKALAPAPAQRREQKREVKPVRGGQVNGDARSAPANSALEVIQRVVGARAG